MKKIFQLFFLIIVIVCVDISCGNSPKEDIFEKAQTTYNKKGFDYFVDYVRKNGYFAVTDSAHNNATPLLVAIQKRDLKTIELFLEQGASLDEKDASGLDILDYALYNFDKAVMNSIITNLPPIYWNAKNAIGQLPCVKVICNCRDYEIITRVLILTDMIDAVDSHGKTLLMYAAQYNSDVRIVKWLLDHYAHINIKNNNQWTALMYAARYNPNPLVAEDLMVRGADKSPNSIGLTLLMLAACNKNPGMLMTVLKYVNDINTQTDQGKTALMYACENKQSTSVIKFLIDNHADVNMHDSNGKTALMYALENYSDTDSVYILITAGSDCNASDNNGKGIREYVLANANLTNTDLVNAIDLKQKERIGNDVQNELIQNTAGIEDTDNTEYTEDTPEETRNSNIRDVNQDDTVNKNVS